MVFFMLGIGLAVCSSSLFPWKLLSGNWLFHLFASYVQYPWRFFSMAVCFLSVVSAAAFYRFYERKEPKKLCFFALLLAVYSCQYMIDDYMRSPAAVWSEMDVTPMIGQWEYLYPGTKKQHLNQNFIPSDDHVIVADMKKEGLSVQFSYSMEAVQEESYIDVPLLYYPGYHAVDASGREVPIQRSETNLIRVIPENNNGWVSVTFHENISWRVAEVISLLSLVWVVVEMLRIRGFGPCRIEHPEVISN